MMKLKQLIPLAFLSLLSVFTFGYHPDRQLTDKDDFRNEEPENFHKLIVEQQGMVVDVGTPQEYAEGHIANSYNMDFEADDFAQRLDALNKQLTYFIYCKSGRRSVMASEQMHEAGFTRVIVLKGGLQGWRDRGYAVTK